LHRKIYQLLAVKKHKDPFDRLTACSFCLQNKWTLLSVDGKLKEYEKQGLK
jgi:PIN domain nuclease of toxin-antitoxin system